MRWRALAVLTASLALACTPAGVRAPAPQSPAFAPGQPWLDTEGAPIEAHAGGVLRVGDTWYWYGENHRLGFGNRTGISAYSSRDLVHWRNEGVVLPKDSLPETFRDGGVAERPKVIYNRGTGRYVMWLHLDANRYAEASAGVAQAASPTGPFRMVRIFRPLAYDYGYSPEESRLQERARGNSFRDMALFQDDDGSAYVLYASESNATMYAARLSDDYTDIARPAAEGKTWARILPAARREAPAPFKHRGKYYLITSGLTGWAPNPAALHVADHMLGPWRALGNPLVGPEAATTYRSQSTFVLPVPRICDACFIFMADRWDSRALERSTYIWLPFVVARDGTIRIEPRERWDLGTFRELRRADSAANGPRAGAEDYRLVWADEFERAGRPDSANWSYERGFVRNRELQWYQPENARVEGGRLVIEARRERQPNPLYQPGADTARDWRRSREAVEYTSASLTTRGLHAWQYGRFEMRARIDVRPGMWPAFWTVGERGRWPASGEIDIMEYYRGQLLANVAWADSTGRAVWRDTRTPLAELGDRSWADRFHVWRMDWDEAAIRLYVDDRLLNAVSLDSTFNGGTGTNPLRQPHHVILNLAVGGTQGGDPAASEFPARYEIDYVRVYQRTPQARSDLRSDRGALRSASAAAPPCGKAGTPCLRDPE